MSAPQTRPYGTWNSPIQPDIFEVGGVELEAVVVNQGNGKIYLVEVRSDEGGRSAIVEYSAEKARDVLPREYSAATHVHEYGGASCSVRPTDGHIIFADFGSNTVFDLDPSTTKVTPIVEKDEKNYFADFSIHPTVSKWVIAIREDHHSEVIDEIQNTLVSIDSGSKEVRTIAHGADFYTFPRFSPDGKKVCWIQWNHPNMPWYETELWLADWKDGLVTNAHKAVGSKESITQPQWSPDGSLFFASDRSGFWQLYKMTGDSIKHVKVSGLDEAEFAGPGWYLGASWYSALTNDTLVAFYNFEGSQKGIVIDIDSGKHVDPGWPINELLFNAVKRISDTSLAVLGMSAQSPTALYKIDVKSSQYEVLRSSIDIPIPVQYLSPSLNHTFPRKYGPGGGIAYCLFKPPTNPDFKAPPGELPPLIVAMHGGPTFQEASGFKLRDQYWTSRGYALVQVNYVGSTGYGKRYVRLLDAQMGVSDIADAASCVDYLVQKGLVDPKRVGITGHSAGGYCTLQALVTYPDLYRAGVGESSISEMQVLFQEIHKMESQYLHGLTFTPDASLEDRKRITRERSAIYSAEKIKAPLLMTHGLDDKVVPPNQPQMMAEKVSRNGGVVKTCMYPGEGHNLHDGKHVKDSIIQTEQWWRKYLVP